MTGEARRRGFLVKAEKITSYLLNPHHPDGRSKAKFFFGYGFSRDTPETLAQALLWRAQPSHFVRELATPWYYVATSRESVEVYFSGVMR